MESQDIAAEKVITAVTRKRRPNSALDISISGLISPTALTGNFILDTRYLSDEGAWGSYPTKWYYQL